MVPLRSSFASLLRWETAHPIVPAKWFHGCAVNGKHVAMCSEPVRLFSVLLFVAFSVAVVEHLHFDAAQKRHARRGDGCAPDKDARVAATGQMPPLHFENEILVLPRRAQSTRGPARTMNHSVAHAPRFRRAIGVHPAGQIAAVEQRNQAIVISSQRSASRGHQEGQGKSFHMVMMSRRSAECTRETNRTPVCHIRGLVLTHAGRIFYGPPTLLCSPLLCGRFTNSIACG